ncbi:phage tail protein [Yersinia bercovieri]|uniref:phage tail protein n=1 Tax=Yersinia bercovieri TaxID=634 RepID=UPI0005DFBA63|nr:phage tail protein [Yersinia bercovieri]CNI89580.1 putative bacteriophage tail fiber protein [Yersinia bercovieri]
MQKIGDIPNTRADNNGEFTDGNVAGGVPPTILPAEWFNTIQRELMSILAAAEIEADSDAFDQVLLSIQKLVSEGIPDLKDASLTQKGIVQLSNSTSSTNESLAATPKAVKAALDASLPIDGTAASATKLATARKIGGVDFDGTKDITLPFINTTDANVQLAGNLGAQGNITVQGSLIAKANIAADGRCDIVGDVRGGRIISKSDVVAGEGRAEGHATLTVDGNIHGTLWGSTLYTFLTEQLIGIPMPHPLSSVPAGWLKCNGAAFSTSTYPRLALRYPSGVLPDMRGNAIRGWDDGRGVDAGRALLSQQLDALQNITGNFYMGGSKQVAGVVTTGAFGPMEVYNALGNQVTTAGNIGGITFDASRVSRTAAETRMRNIAFNYIVRAI